MAGYYIPKAIAFGGLGLFVGTLAGTGAVDGLARMSCIPAAAGCGILAVWYLARALRVRQDMGVTL